VYLGTASLLALGLWLPTVWAFPDSVEIFLALIPFTIIYISVGVAFVLQYPVLREAFGYGFRGGARYQIRYQGTYFRSTGRIDDEFAGGSAVA
jgi:hypothetical protein